MDVKDAVKDRIRGLGNEALTDYSGLLSKLNPDLSYLSKEEKDQAVDKAKLIHVGYIASINSPKGSQPSHFEAIINKTPAKQTPEFPLVLSVDIHNYDLQNLKAFAQRRLYDDTTLTNRRAFCGFVYSILDGNSVETKEIENEGIDPIAVRNKVNFILGKYASKRKNQVFPLSRKISMEAPRQNTGYGIRHLFQ